MKTIALTGSNSSQSINAQLISHAAGLVSGTTVLKLTDYEFPMYGIDLEMSEGIPENIKQVMGLLQAADRVLVATPEHNGSIPAYFKNILDWLSRTGVKYLAGKKVVVLSASTGRGGGQKAAEYASKLLTYAGGEIVGMYSLPSFKENFDVQNGTVTNETENEKLKEALAQF